MKLLPDDVKVPLSKRISGLIAAVPLDRVKLPLTIVFTILNVPESCAIPPPSPVQTLMQPAEAVLLETVTFRKVKLPAL